MADKEYAPLSTACARALVDRVYDKRKTAALEIEKMVKDFVSVRNTVQLKKLLKVLGTDLIGSSNAHMRKGGLIGLAAMAIGLGKASGDYAEGMVYPILPCLKDADSRVRFYACEALYNVAKVLREYMMPLFNEVFGSVCYLVADQDQSVKSASEMLDRLLKDIITELPSFNVALFVPVLRERMYTKDRWVRQFLISWIGILDNVPDLEMIIYLPELLEPLLIMLDDPKSVTGDSSDEITTMCKNQLGEFLRSIIEQSEKVDFPAMINILIVHSQSDNVVLQQMSVTWMREFVCRSGNAMLPFSSGILNSVLPCLAYETEERRTVRELSKTVSDDLMKLVEQLKSNTAEGAESPELDLANLVQVLIRHLQTGVQQSKVAALQWIHHLLLHISDKMPDHVDLLTPVLLKTLSDHSDEVVILDLEVLAQISMLNVASPDSATVSAPHFSQFILSLLKLFCADRNLLESKGSFIIRQLCLFLKPEDIYKCMAELLLQEESMRFTTLMVDTLSTILLTSSELFDLRLQLKELASKESCHLFCTLYQTWSHSQVATLSLCLLCGCYAHALDIIRVMGDQEVTVEMLMELDRLVQLLESPIFTFLRMELLDGEQELVSALYGILMLLPQSEAYRLIQNRLGCVPRSPTRPKAARKKKKFADEIDFSRLLAHFQDVRDTHQQATRKEKIKKVLASTLL